MTSNTKIEEIRRKAEESSNKYFSEQPKEVSDELEKESSFGNPENLVKPDNADE